MIRRNTQEEKSLRLFELHFLKQELRDIEQYRKRCIDQEERTRLRRSAQIHSRALEDRLHREGFRGETVMALEWFPVAKAAWASGSVTHQEKQEVQLVLGELGLGDSREASQLLDDWLRKEPPDALWGLWEQFTMARSRAIDPGEFQERAQKIHQACFRVASASGGILGMGRISVAEHRVLRRVKGVMERAVAFQ
jgi:hypothetical protein